LLTLWTMSRSGCRTDARTLLFVFFPAVLLFGIHFTAVGLAILVVISSRTDWILNRQERADIDALALPFLKKMRIPVKSLWP